MLQALKASTHDLSRGEFGRSRHRIHASRVPSPAGPTSRSGGGGCGERAGAFLSGALGAALLAAALAFPAGEAQAQTATCGALTSGAATCSNQAFSSGIRYDAGNEWGQGVSSNIAVTVTGGAATTIGTGTPISSPTWPVVSWGSGIVRV